MKVKKNPNAPPVITGHRNRLRYVKVDEVSSVDDGGNQFSDVILMKLYRGRKTRARGNVRKLQSVFLQEAATAGPAHAHGPAEMPEGEIAAGTFRFGAGGEGDHDHTVTLARDLEAGGQVELLSSVSGLTAHQHNVTITARGRVEAMRSKRRIEELAKVWAEAPAEGLEFSAIEEALRKIEEEPPTLDEVMTSGRIYEIDSALDDRSRAFMSTTFAILMSDSEEKEALILAAVSDFAGLMEADVPDLFAGRLAKKVAGELAELLSGETAPTLADVRKRVANLLSTGSDKGNRMSKKQFQTLNDDDSAALEKIRKDAADGAVALKTATDALATATAETERLRKLAAGIDPEPEINPLLKNLSEEHAKAFGPIVEHFEGELKKSNTERDGLKLALASQAKAHRHGELVEIAKSFDSIGTPVDDLVTLLEAAEAAGTLEAFRKTLTAANTAAAKGLKQIGVDSSDVPTIGFGKGSDAAKRFEANQRVEKKAEEIRKGHEQEMTLENAWVLAAKELPADAALAAEIPQ